MTHVGLVGDGVDSGFKSVLCNCAKPLLDDVTVSVEQNVNWLITYIILSDDVGIFGRFSIDASYD